MIGHGSGGGGGCHVLLDEVLVQVVMVHRRRVSGRWCGGGGDGGSTGRGLGGGGSGCGDGG